MSIAETILNMQQNLSKAYVKVAEKGATIPEDKNLENLSSAIESISNKLPQFLDRTLTEIAADDLVGATSIGYYAFYRYENLMSIEIPDSVTGIGAQAFLGCKRLTSVVMGKNVVSIAGGAFYNCSSLASVVIPDGVTSIESEAFRNCSSLTEVVIGNNVARIRSYAFSGCNSLTSMEIPDSVTSIETNALHIGSSQNKATITILSETPPTISEKTFNVDSLEQIVIPYGRGETYKIATNWSVFADYLIEESTEGLEYTFLEDETSYMVSSIGTATDTNIIIPFVYKGLSVTSIGDSAFSGCRSLASVVIPDSVTSIGAWAFYECGSLTSINIPNGVTSIGSNAFSRCWELINIEIPNKVTKVGNYCFQSCTHLKSIIFHGDIERLGINFFYACIKLDTIDFSKAQSIPLLANVEAFYNVPSTCQIIIPDELYDEWINATNWSALNLIYVKASEYTEV